MTADHDPLAVTLVGHTFSPLGIGRALRVAFMAMQTVGIEARLLDVWDMQPPEESHAIALNPYLTKDFGDVNVFHLNGDEIAPALDHLGSLPAGYNIVVPFWELPRYPAEWARQVERFDEVWAASDYIRRSIGAAVSRPVTHMPLATEIQLDRFRGRRAFGIPEGAYVFLFFFDCRSYASRKNPEAVVECFRRLRQARPRSRSCLVIKMHGAEAAPETADAFIRHAKAEHEPIVILQGTMQEVEVHNLIRCCDAFVSLHRSEGFGLGLAEAMYLGVPVIGTAHSGNMDFMTPDNSVLVGYEMVPVPPGAYPHAEDQFWAEPDLDEATSRMIALIDDPAAARALGARGSRSIRTNFSYRASGLRYAQRLGEISHIPLGGG